MSYRAFDEKKKQTVIILEFAGSGNGPVVGICCADSGELYCQEVSSLTIDPRKVFPEGERISIAPAGVDLKAKPGTTTPLPQAGKRK